MKRTLKLTLDQARTIFKKADDSLKTLLEANFGKSNLIGRPIGVWCLTTDKRAVIAEDWDTEDTSIGVGVITENTSFIVHLEPQVALPFSSKDVDEYDDIVYDEETYDNAVTTKCIIEARNDVKGEVWNNNKLPYNGAPAAEYCVHQGGALPTLATTKEIAANIEAINNAMMTVGGAVVCGWLWTSTLQKCNNCAFVVYSSNGNVYYESRDSINYARAVSAFHFEEFQF